ncbi:MAG: thioredoxin family protein [bacterium]
MKLIKKLIILFALIFPLFTFSQSSHLVDVFFFYQNGCPHCEEMKLFLAGLVRDNGAIKINAYEVNSDDNNKALFMEMAKAYNTSIDGVPMLFIGAKVINGNYPTEVENEITKCLSFDCESPMKRLDKKATNKSDDALVLDMLKIRWIALILAIIFIVFLIYFSKKKRNVAQ